MTRPIKPTTSSRQVVFHQLLVGARKTWLIDALSVALNRVDPIKLKAELAKLVPTDAQRIIAAAGIRDEHVFPVPAILEADPRLVGYYRLLLGVPQKTFYGMETGMGQFKSMEARGVINDRQRTALPAFCSAMTKGLAEMVRQLSPRITPRDVAELPLLTLGAQFQGSNNNAIGKLTILEVFSSIREIVKNHIVAEDERKLTIKNSAGRIVVIALAGDPDVRIQEEFGNKLQNKVAVEIKGGTDRSNAHNRAGEAEKSHQKARGEGFRDFWTIIAKAGLDLKKLSSESPTTNSWFDAPHILGRKGSDWEDFRTRLASQVGIPIE
jgi:hypothetical protein